MVSLGNRTRVFGWESAALPTQPCPPNVGATHSRFIIFVNSYLANFTFRLELVVVVVNCQGLGGGRQLEPLRASPAGLTTQAILLFYT